MFLPCSMHARLEQSGGVGMGRHRRCQIEIMCDILRFCSESRSKTRIVYSANLNFHRLKMYLGILLRLGFVDENKNSSGNTVYKTTSDGRNFLESFVGTPNKLENLLSKTR